MMRPIAIVGAPTALGIKPYDDGHPRQVDLAPSVYRALGISTQLGARDDGDVTPAGYRDTVRNGMETRNEDLIVRYSHELAARVANAGANGEFVLVLGGDCSIVTGTLFGVRSSRQRVGLAYLDSHADFALPEQSRTGSASSMCLGHAVGHGSTPLSRLRDDGPLVREEDTVIVGRNPAADEPEEAKEALLASRILDLNRDIIRGSAPGSVPERVLERVTGNDADGFWIHFDADVQNPELVPSVDSPEPGGLSFEEAIALLRPLVNHPAALGMQVTIHDPGLDPDGRGGRAMVQVIVSATREGVQQHTFVVNSHVVQHARAVRQDKLHKLHGHRPTLPECAVESAPGSRIGFTLASLESV